MPFPESDRVIFEENTLVEVICQLRFPTILAIATEPPAEFQERIREAYPIYRKGDPFSGLPPNFLNVLSELPIPVNPTQGVTHFFDTEDGRRTVSLAPEFVAVTEQNYTTWDLFSEEVERAKAAVEAIYAPSFYTRLGLRYQDVVRKADLGFAETPWRDLLAPAFTGLLAAEPVSADVEAIRSDCVIRLFPDREARVQITHGVVADSEGQRYRIDMDFYDAERRDGEHVRDVLDEFHRQAGYLFRWAILPPLQEALRPSPLDAT